MTDDKKPRVAFRHPALDQLDREKAALRAVLRALAPLDGPTALRVLERARATEDSISALAQPEDP